jgi:hypothetical protein
VIALLNLRKPDRWGQLVPGHFVSVTKGFTLALHDERWCLDRPKMLNTQLIWLADWVKGIAQTHKPSHSSLIRDEAGNSTNH